MRISGGGRCNVTHACFDLPTLLTHYPRGADFLVTSLKNFSPQHTNEWFLKRGVKLKTEADGRMFPITDSSETIAACLEREALRLGVSISLQTDVKSIEKNGDTFILETNKGTLETKTLLVATGGHPKLEGYAWLAKLGVSVVKPVPSLFTFNLPGHPVTQLQGLSVSKASIRVAGFEQITSGPLLITHWGLSGPAVLKMSAWAARYFSEKDYHFEFWVNWMPGYNENQLIAAFKSMAEANPKQWVTANPLFELPARLWKFLCSEAGIGEQQRWAETGKKQWQHLANTLLGHPFIAKGKTTFKEEFVTAGGVAVDFVLPQTMESLQVPGLYFAGEVLDIDGVTGGFNFQAAWATGYAAAEGMLSKR